jgi:hypothetical protein
MGLKGSSLASGVFGSLVALAFSSVLIGFVALNNSGTAGAITAVAIAVAGFAVGFGVARAKGT